MRLKSILVALLLVSNVAFGSELVIVESTSPRYEVAQIISDADPIVLDEGTGIVLISEDGVIIGLAGPFEGPLTTDGTDEAYDALRALGVLIGQSEIEARDIGGVRYGSDDLDDVDPVRDVEDSRDSVWVLHSTMGGTQCVPADADRVSYWRENDGQSIDLNIKHLASGAATSAEWRAGDKTMPWPEDIDLVFDEVYLLRSGGELRSVALIVREVPASVTANDSATVAWLAANGCIAQARLAFAGLR